MALAGGGTRGAYHLGAWKSLLENNFFIDSVTGTSIGSVNAALIVQGDFEKAVTLWRNIELKDVLKIDSKLLDSDNLLDYKNIISLVQEVIRKDGLQTMPFQRTLENVIDEDLIRNSDLLYGLNTTSLTDVESVELFIDDIPHGGLIDAIMASTCFPGFQKRYIDNKLYADGGILNNLPIGMLLKKGCKNIIAVDVGGIGMVKNENYFDANIITVRCKKPLIGMFDFRKESIDKSIKQGYLDTNKTLGKLMGDSFYFNTVDYCKAKAKYSDEILKGIEIAADAFGIEFCSVYRIDDFIKGILEFYKRNSDNVLEANYIKIRSDDASIIMKLVQIIESGNVDGLNNGIMNGWLGSRLTAAKAIAYLLKQ